MKKNFTVKYTSLAAALILVFGITACKKNKSAEPEIVPETVSEGKRSELSKDSIFLYAKQIYLWNDAIPAYDVFNPQKYTGGATNLANYQSELYAISQLKINPLTGKPYEYSGAGYAKYSRIEDLTAANPDASADLNLSDVDTEGNGNDIGIRPIFYLTSTDAPRPYLLFVTAVYQNSPAEAAGVKRGWVITKINGKSVGAGYDSERNTVTSALSAASVDIEGKNFTDGTPFKLTLKKGSYKSSAVYASKVFTKSNKKIGYLSYARFSRLSNPSNTSPSDVDLDKVFSNFSSEGVSDLIIDLRYNGGGYVNTAEYLANLIGPSSLTGKKMYTEIYNSTMQANKATILSNQLLLDSKGKIQYENGRAVTYADLDYSSTAEVNNPSFVKKGSLNNINNVVFIVTENTASASELLINCLKPYINVKLVGTTTYGKPVGFFPIKLENRYEVYMSLFETRNSNNEGGYYQGMVPNVTDEFDDPTYPFGDERENYVSLALNILAPSAVPVANKNSTMSVGGKSINLSTFKATQLIPVNPNSEFVGMIETRHTMK